MIPTNRRLLWIGDIDQTAEFCHVAESISSEIEMHQYPSVDVALNATTSHDPDPTIICLAETHPGQIQYRDVLRLAHHWPLSRIVAVGSCLSDGRRRSGPVVDGILEVPWHDLRSRMQVWLQRIESGSPSSLSRAPTLRREERWLAEAIELQTSCDSVTRSAQVTVTVAASSKTMTEAVGELVTAAGGLLVNCITGKPAIEDTADVILWDLYDSPDSQLEWIRLLTSQKPNRALALLCSFPRGDSAQAAMEAGATTVLGRPTDCEAIRGVLFSTKTALLADSGKR